jgi:hypothetical protein
MAQQITQTQTPTENKPFFEINVTREGSQFMAARGDIEVSGFVSSKLRHVVEEIAGRVLDMAVEVQFSVHHAANVISDFVAANTHVSDYMSTQLSVKAGEVYMTLGAHLFYDIERNEWRGSVEAVIESRWKKWHVKLAVKKRVVFKGINVNSQKLYQDLIEVARRANTIAVKEK